MAKCYVWLDAGHSKVTPGKRNTVASPDFFEYEFNNDIAVKLKKRLEEHGITVYLTNTTPNGADIDNETTSNTSRYYKYQTKDSAVVVLAEEKDGNGAYHRFPNILFNIRKGDLDNYEGNCKLLHEKGANNPTLYYITYRENFLLHLIFIFIIALI